MPRKSKIRWSKEDKKEVTNAVRKFNSKITRTLKKNPEWAEYLPQRITTKELIAKSETRQDFKRELNAINRFMKKGAERPITTDKGIKTTLWEKKEVGLKVAIINRRRTNEAKKANVSTYKGTMGTIESNNLKHKVYNIDNIRANDWDKYIKAVEKQIRTNYQGDKVEKYKENYLRAILENLGDSEETMKLYNYVQGIDADFMYGIYYDDPVLQIQFTSDPLPVDTIVENALEHWKRAVG